jgi:alkylated DNA repair dioxygenase AlkB
MNGQYQTSLFTTESESLPITNGSLQYYPGWLAEDKANQLFSLCKEQVDWQQSVIQLYGKSVRIPRLNAWYGDADCPYRYSGHSFSPKPWLPELLALKERVVAQTGIQFNSVLVNYYRNGYDGVAWHSDDEPELGRNPVVASISLGVEREFQLRHRYQKDLAVTKLQLAHGSLLVMGGELQHYWHHQLPKSRRQLGERINLTYRYIHTNSE